jgi:hypothetical protein
MKVNEAIKKAMKETGTTYNDLQRKLKLKTAGQVSSRMSKDNWTITTMLTYLDQIGYEVVIRPYKKKAKDEIVINGISEEMSDE